jgi:hypothetical protein
MYTYSIVRFVPDPARGESINFGLLVGDDDAREWELRLGQNLKRARAVDDRGALPLALAFADQLEGHIEALEALPGTGTLEPISLELVRRLSGEMNNVVQLSEPTPVAAETAAEAFDLLFEELLVDPAVRRYQFEKKHRAVKATRLAYRNHEVPDDAIEERAPVAAGPYDGMFDFAVANGRALQLVQCWSFQLPNQAELAEQVKAWAWVVRALREQGGAVLHAAGRDVDIPQDVEIAAVAVPPRAGQQDAHAYEEAQAAFAATGVAELTPEQADELGEHAAARLHAVA